MALIRVGEEEFNVTVDGPADAPALMLSNSLGTTYAMWDPQIAELTRRFRVIRYDTRGHGQSVVSPGPYSIAQLGRDALGILDALGIEKTHWVGLSLGGMIGQWLVTHAPTRIDRAVFANTGAQLGALDIWNMRTRTALTQGMEPLVDGVVARWLTPDFVKAHPEVREGICAMVRATPPVGYAGCSSAIRDMDQREAIRRVTRPVLVIIGANDPAASPAVGQLIANSIPGAKLVTLKTAHLSNIEDPQGFTRAVVSFLTAKATPPRKAKTKRSAKKAPAKKPAAKKAAPKKGTAKKGATKKGATKKAAAKKRPAKKQALKKGAAKKTAARKPARKAARKAAARKSTRR